MSEEQEQQATPVEQQSNDQVNALQRSIEALERKNHELIGKLQKAKKVPDGIDVEELIQFCLLYTSPSPRDQRGSRMPSSA